MCKVNYTKKVKHTLHYACGLRNERVVGLKTKIQELRKQNKVTQEELAAALGVTRQTIISLENGKYNASLQLAFKIARFFEQSIEDIFLYEEE